MKNVRFFILIAFAVVLATLTVFTFSVLAEPEIFDSPQILADTDENFVLRDNINGTETAYSNLGDPLESLKNKSGNYTLYFMRDYTTNNFRDFVTQRGTYTLLVRSAGNNTYTYKSTRFRHFRLDHFNNLTPPMAHFAINTKTLY